MNKSDLRTGMKVVLKNGEILSVIKGYISKSGTSIDVLVNYEKKSSLNLINYHDNLTRHINIGEEDESIHKIYNSAYPSDFINPEIVKDDNLIWERQEPVTLEVALISQKQLKPLDNESNKCALDDYQLPHHVFLDMHNLMSHKEHDKVIKLMKGMWLIK